jgi:zinc/manganese transport system substrate-binding protein
MNRNMLVTVVVIIVVVLAIGTAAGVYVSMKSTMTSTGQSTSFSSSDLAGSTTSDTGSVSSKPLQIVAAENFWGSLASQLVGVHGNVTSIVTDPNTDPHEYQTNPADAIAIANAQLVIINGMNYDTWAQLLINASNTPGQVVLDAQQIVGLNSSQVATVNPHLWYSPWYVNDTVHAIYNALVKLDPADTSYFTANYATLNASLYQDYMQAEQQMRAEYAGNSSTVVGGVLRYYSGGTNITATESIVQFLANATGLNIITPVSFMFAVAEGNDPSPADIATFQQQLSEGNQSVRCLVYNIQTVMPITQQIKVTATQYEIPITFVSETIQPPTLSFQAWQEGQVAGLQNCLNSVALGN